METHQQFGRRLFRLRKRAGLTQEQLGKAARLSAAAICNIERGAYPPAFTRLGRIAAALQVELYELFLFED